MRYWTGTIVIFIIAILCALWLGDRIPQAYNPFAPLAVSDAPNLITRYKLRRLDGNPQACLDALDRAQSSGAILSLLVQKIWGESARWKIPCG